MTDSGMSGEAEALDLRRHTMARVSLGCSGPAIGTSEQLRFQLDHALARDAVHAQMDVGAMLGALRQRQMECVALGSAAVSGDAAGSGQSHEGRAIYLRRPDLGRRLSEASRLQIGESRAQEREKDGRDRLAIVIADGLSALAVERHGMALLDALWAVLDFAEWRVAPVSVVSQGRVAIGDEIGERLGARAVVVLIGERPGLSSPDSLGVYITWEPRVGRTDAERNCISNVRAEGLSYRAAADRIVFYLRGGRRLGASGVELRWVEPPGANGLLRGT